MALTIAIVPKGAAAGPDNSPDMPDDGVAQDIVQKAKALAVDDLTTLMHGISPEALEVMEKIPELAAFANFIESGGTGEAPDTDDQPSAPPTDARSQVAAAMRQQGIR